MGHHDKNNFSVVGMNAPGACGREKQGQEVGADNLSQEPGGKGKPRKPARRGRACLWSIFKTAATGGFVSVGMRWPWGVRRSRKRGNGLWWAGTLPCHCDRRDEREDVAEVGGTGDVPGVGDSVRTSAFSALDGGR